MLIMHPRRTYSSSCDAISPPMNVRTTAPDGASPLSPDLLAPRMPRWLSASSPEPAEASVDITPAASWVAFAANRATLSAASASKLAAVALSARSAPIVNANSRRGGGRGMTPDTVPTCLGIFLLTIENKSSATSSGIAGTGNKTPAAVCTVHVAASVPSRGTMVRTYWQHRPCRSLQQQPAAAQRQCS